MKVTKIRLLACWDGYCGTCRDVRPLVLTRSGRFSLRAWWAGAGDEDRPLTMTCRVCGTGVHVPRHEEDDDLELDLLDDDVDDDLDDVEVEAAPSVPVTATADSPASEQAAAPAAAPAPTATVEAGPELTAVRTALASALAAVVERSSAAAGPAELTPQRSGAHDDTDEALRLLAVGFDTRDLTGEPAHS